MSFGRVRVAGVAIGRYALRDGRPGDTSEMVADMVAHFAPGVPILLKHGGVPIGTIDSVVAEHGRDLRFTGEVVDYPDVVERLRKGVPVSIELVEGVEPTPGVVTRDAEFTDTHPHWRGQVALGWNLIAVALSDSPAAPGSLMWVADDAVDR
jgi:hypothetical protein